MFEKKAFAEKSRIVLEHSHIIHCVIIACFQHNILLELSQPHTFATTVHRGMTRTHQRGTNNLYRITTIKFHLHYHYIRTFNFSNAFTTPTSYHKIILYGQLNRFQLNINLILIMKFRCL